MPHPPAPPLFNLDVAKIHCLDTQNVHSLYTIWSAFQKCSDFMEDGKRLENLSWRIWNRETFCCSPDRRLNRHLPPTTQPKDQLRVDDIAVPALSSSVDSAASSHCDRATPAVPTTSPPSVARPQLRREDSSYRREKHVTPVDFMNIVASIKDQKSLEPLPPLTRVSPPAPSSDTTCDLGSTHHDSPKTIHAEDRTPRSSSPRFIAPDSSTSTVATTLDSDKSEDSPPLRANDSDTNATDMSSHSIVRGFSLGQISSSYRSHSHPKISPAPLPIRAKPSKKKGTMFQIGANSSEEPDSSLETHMQEASAHSLQSIPSSKKQTSFKEEVMTRTIQEPVDEHEEVFVSDDEEVSESAIEDDEDEDDWEDSVTESGHSSVDERQLFKRVDSKPNLTSQRSLLTSMMHETDRAAALQHAASSTRPVMRRSRTSTPNGPSLATSPQEEPVLEMPGRGIPRARISIPSNANQYPPTLSPRTTRRNMLSTELTESLRNHLLWERKQKNNTSNAAIKRRHTSQDVKNLQQYPSEPQLAGPLLKKGPNDAMYTNTWNNYFDHGLQDFHRKGW